MSDIYSLPYTNPIDSLILDPIVEPETISMNTKDDLNLWTNAQFTYNVKPPAAQSSIGDKSPDSDSSRSSNSNSPNNENMTYGYLTQVPPIPIDYAPMFKNITVSPENLSQTTHHQPLLPKVSLDDLAKALLTPLIPDTAVTQKPNNKPSKIIDNKEKTTVDEDKRRRNTAASARFRIKKKQREQNMEKTVKEMTEKSETLQNRVHELEQEIKWLRGLLIEKESVSAHK